MPTETFFNLPEEKRKMFLECAIDEFAQNDYESASISKIVARAGIAKGSLYQYFKDKRDLYHYLLELAAQKKAELLTSEKVAITDVDLFDLLRQLFQVMSGYELRYPKLAAIGNRALHSNSPLPPDLVEQGRQSSQQYFQSLIERGKQRGEIRADVDPEIASFIFATLIAEIGLLLKKRSSGNAAESPNEFPRSSVDIKNVYNQVVSILKDGIAA